MTKNESTSKTHEFLPSGCRYQWAADHDAADCWQAFMDRYDLGVDGQPAERWYPNR